MSEPYLGEIRMFAGNFAPKSNAYCAGQLMSITQNSALFSLLGTYYGGNGTTTFALPDLRGRMPICMGQGPGLSNYTIGQPVGSESVMITPAQLPMHTHTPVATTVAGGSITPGGMIPAALPAPPWTSYWVKDANKTGSPLAMAPTAVGTIGGSQPHENRMPLLAISIIIALLGIFPSRN
jgi:microcystin-dependent protein